ncbi:macrophage-expressed gene 1 protein-like [Ambystoma mexicanum]|uniref:macrophage-expressed gene 1 protein-like n=1 Tax=Ambystoma mexicanum TaxID=8296 RepID=UPI0037E94148
MCSFTVNFLLLCTFLALEKQRKCHYASAQDNLPSGLWQCKKALKVPTLEVLPGGGWDNLRNLDMGRVMKVDYSSCKTTEDNAYFIPDAVFVIPQKQTNLEMNSEIVASWKEYKSFTSSSINAEMSIGSLISGRFSTEFQNMKTHQVKDESFTTRVQLRNLRYTVKAIPNFKLDTDFKSQLVEIANHLENNQTRTANFLAEMLILNYGTHVLTSVDAGACLVQEDHIRSSFLSDSWSQRKSITASAGISFHSIISFGIGVNTSSGNSFTNSYLENRTSSRVESIGGVPFYPGITLKTWQEGITNQLVAIDRSGLPIPYFINTQTLPDLPEPSVHKLVQTVEAASSRYYKVNTYPGCTDATSPNFNFHANVDDASCEGMMTNYTFGGTFQECRGISGGDTGVICQGLRHKNPLTEDFSCPQGYAAVKLISQNKEHGFTHSECHSECDWFNNCHQVCGDVFRVSTAQFTAYWCVAQGEVPEYSGYLFGGLYNSKSINPLTSTQSCPFSFFPLKLLVDLEVCVSSDFEMGYQYSAPFGGFFSCEEGNPLALSKFPPSLKGSWGQVSQTAPPKKCPPGFSQHLALISDACQVNYCVKSGLFAGMSLPSVRLPPFSSPPVMSVGSTKTVLVLTESERSWVKDDGTKMWKLTNTADASNTMRMVRGDGGQISGGEAAGITVGVTTALAVLIAMAIYGRRRYRSRGYQEVERRQLVMVKPPCEETHIQEEGDHAP